MTSESRSDILLDKEKIDRFLARLAEAWHSPAKVYLLGGSAMILRGHKGFSRDIDMGYEVDAERSDAFYDTAREVADTLGYPIDVAEDPGSWSMVETPNWRGRSRPYATIGTIEVWLWHPVDILLGKVSRGTAEDWSDIEKLLAGDRLALSEIQARYDEMFQASRPSDEKRFFRERFQLFLRDFGPRLIP